MTVKEILGVLKSAKTIALGWDGASVEFQPKNLLMLEAYGNFVVDSIQPVGDDEEGYFEINIAMRPVKAGE